MKRKLLFITCLISFSALRAQVTVTPENTTQCAGEIAQLNATGGSSGTSTLFSENFEGGGMGNFTATVVTGSTNASQWANRTSPYTPTGSVWHPLINSGSKFALSNSDLNVGAVNFALESGVLNTTGYTSLALTFRHYYSDYSTSDTGDFANIEVSVNGGTSWTTIQTYSTDQGSESDFASVNIPLGSYLNQPNFKFRLRYIAAWNDGWAVDDVVVSGMSSSAASFTWTPVAGLYTDAAATVPYTGSAAATVYAKPVATTTYTASYTSGSDTFTDTAVITVTNPAAPTANATQSFCSAATVADLMAEGTVSWYEASSGGSPLAATAALVNGTTYYASQTVSGCEGTARTPVAVTVHITAAPTVAETTQTFCNSATIANLDADGDGVKWYAANTGGTELEDDAALVSGTSYYASQTIDGCESTARTAVMVSIHITDAPTVAESTQTFCNAATIGDLTANGTDIKWYAAESGGTELSDDTALVSGTSYYASQSISDCESAGRTMVMAQVNMVSEPGGDAIQEINVGTADEATIEDIEITATGTVTWYASEEDALNGENAIPVTTQLVSGTTYYAMQTVGECTSLTAMDVTVDVVLGNKNFSMASLTYSPNPVKDMLTVSYSSDITSITVHNTLGQQVMAQQPNAAETKVDMSGLAAGTYMVKVTSGSNMKTLKIIKQ